MGKKGLNRLLKYDTEDLKNAFARERCYGSENKETTVL